MIFRYDGFSMPCVSHVVLVCSPLCNPSSPKTLKHVRLYRKQSDRIDKNKFNNSTFVTNGMKLSEACMRGKVYIIIKLPSSFQRRFIKSAPITWGNLRIFQGSSSSSRILAPQVMQSSASDHFLSSMYCARYRRVLFEVYGVVLIVVIRNERSTQNV